MRPTAVLPPVLLALAAALLPAQVAADPVVGRKGMVVSPEPLATAVGLEVLKEGGNAVDAAVAVGFALAVTKPAAGNLGGGGFMVLHLPEGRDVAVDYREMAPAAATRDMYLGPDGEPVAARSRLGHLAAGVPGSPAGLVHVQSAYGSWPLARVVAPAVRLAREGFPVSRFLARSLNGAGSRLRLFEESRRVFLKGGGRWKVGEVLRQRDLAATLERIAEEGASGFYKGKTARLVVEEMKRGGGLVTLEDLEAYEVKERPPIEGTYRGHEVVSMPPPSSGGVALVTMLNVLEPYPIGRLGFGSERTLHLMAEAMRGAFEDRARHLGDPDFSEIPVERLLSTKHAAALRGRIGETARRSAPEGTVSLGSEKEQTLHYSVMDAEGRAVACTTTLNGSYGCAVTVEGAGFLLNNEMDDFAAAPGRPNMYGLVQGEANAVGPRRRPLSSMTPTLVKRDGRVVMVVGSPGGPTIINTVLQAIVNVLDHGMDVSQALAAPRIHHQWLPDVLYHEEFGICPDAARGLAARGHELKARSRMGDAQAITYDPKDGIFRGASDPRWGGRAMGF